MVRWLETERIIQQTCCHATSSFCLLVRDFSAIAGWVTTVLCRNIFSSSAKVKDAWCFTFIPPFSFTAWCLDTGTTLPFTNIYCNVCKHLLLRSEVVHVVLHQNVVCFNIRHNFIILLSTLPHIAHI